MQTQRRQTDASLPVLDRVFLGRGEAHDAHRTPLGLSNLIPPNGMKGIDDAARILCDVVMGDVAAIVASDFDSDGAGAAATAVLGLRALGATRVDFIIPNRVTMGYGLSPLLAEAAAETGAKVLITADNGISSIEGVKRARDLGMICLVSDHHLAPDVLPDADVIVNPNQPGCDFASKNLCGCGVIFYVLLATRSRLKALGWFDRAGSPPYPNLAMLLDFVANSTIGDLVQLDRNNRALVAHGLRLMREGRAHHGINALLRVAGIDVTKVNSGNLAFAVAPRINAAGRIEDMRLGVDCLLSLSDEAADQRASTLNEINARRRAMQRDMTEVAIEMSEHVVVGASVVVHSPDFHEGIVGLVATRLKDQHHRPAIVFANAEGGKLKGSGRSIPGFHLRDALAEVQGMAGSPILNMGGHAMASGLGLRGDGLETFKRMFEDVCARRLLPHQMERVTLTDGELSPQEVNLHVAKAIEDAGPWGQGFEEPLFEGSFTIHDVKTMGAEGQHARYSVNVGGNAVTAVHFNAGDGVKAAGSTIDMTYRMNVNRWKNKESLQLIADEVL